MFVTASYVIRILSLWWRPPLFELQDRWISMAGV